MPEHFRYVVRPARTEDLETLVRFSAAMAMETEGRSLDHERLRQGTLAVMQTHDKGFYLVTENPNNGSNALIGQLMVTYEWSDWRNACFWWVQSVYVDPAWRRRGVYRQMHEEVLERARATGNVCGLRLYVEGNNQAAQNVYERVGLSRSSYRVFEIDFVLVTHSGQHHEG